MVLRGRTDGMPRRAWLDAMRGIAIALMVLSDDAGTAWNCALEHAPWHGLALADIVFPLFLFASGASLSRSRRFSPGRVANLIVLGLLLQGRRGRAAIDLSTLRIPGILQRVALAGLPVQLIASARLSPRLSARLYAATAIALSLLYIYLTTAMHTCPGDTDIYAPDCNAALAIDRAVLGEAHMYAWPSFMRSAACSTRAPCAGLRSRLFAPRWCFNAFDPEGILGTINATVAVLLAALLSAENSAIALYGSEQVVAAAALAWAGAVLWYGGIPINKSLYTTSYLLVTTALSAAVAFAVRALDSTPVRGMLAPFAVMGAYPLWMFAIGGAGLTESVLRAVTVSRGHSLLDAVEALCLRQSGGNSDVAEVVYAVIKLSIMSTVAMTWARRKRAGKQD